MILPATAEETGGRCLPCKNGIRADIEASREFYRLQKQYDPLRELWNSLVQRSSDDPTLEGWSEQEKRYFSVSLLEGEVYNGGFDQYFSNSSADYYQCALEGLEDLSAFEALRIVEAAAATLFGDEPPPRDQTSRWKITSSKIRRVSDIMQNRRRREELSRLDSEFYDLPEDLSYKLVAYAKLHKLDAPFQFK